MDARRYGHFYDTVTVTGSGRVHLGDIYHIRDESHTYSTTNTYGGFVLQGNNYGTIQVPQALNEDPLSARVIKWLQPPPRNAPESISRSRGTNEWFLQGPQFQHWVATPASALHLHGPRGCGKTVLSFSVLEALSKLRVGNSANTLFFFFSTNDPGRRDRTSMLKGLLWQLSETIGIPKPLLDVYNEYCHLSSRGPLNGQELANVFVQAISGLNDHLYLVLDGLDEVEYGPRRAEVVQLLDELVALRQQHIHILLTSRSEPDITGYFDESDGWRSTLVDSYKIARDIEAYVDEELSRYPDLRKLSSNTKDMIRKRLCPSHNDMFQWTVLQLDRIKYMRRTSNGKVRALLDNLPTTLDETYTKVLQQVPGDDRAQAMIILKCLVLARRPLMAEELQELANISKDDDQALTLMDIFCMLPSMILVDPWPRSGMLNNLPDGQHTVFLSHFSIQEFLTSPSIQQSKVAGFAIEPESSHRQISGICIRYLLANNTLEKRYQRYCLREYAWEYWSDHAVIKGVGPRREEDKESRLLFCQVSYHGRIERLPNSVVEALPADGLLSVQQSLAKPYCDETFIDYSCDSAPFSVDEPALQNLLTSSAYYRADTLVHELLQARKTDAPEYSTFLSYGDLGNAPSPHRKFCCLSLYRHLTVGSKDIRFQMHWEYHIRRNYYAECIFTFSDIQSADSDTSNLTHILRINSIPVKVSSTLLRYLQAQQSLSGHLWIDEVCLPLSFQLDLAASASSTSPETVQRLKIGRSDDESYVRRMVLKNSATLLLGDISCNLPAYIAAMHSIGGDPITSDYSYERATRALAAHNFDLGEYAAWTRSILERLATFPELLSEVPHLEIVLGSIKFSSRSFLSTCTALNFLYPQWAKDAPSHALVKRHLDKDHQAWFKG